MTTATPMRASPAGHVSSYGEEPPLALPKTGLVEVGAPSDTPLGQPSSTLRLQLSSLPLQISVVGVQVLPEDVVLLVEVEVEVEPPLPPLPLEDDAEDPLLSGLEPSPCAGPVGADASIEVESSAATPTTSTPHATSIVTAKPVSGRRDRLPILA